jgi:ribulose-phosphate 3-epimerase
MADVVLSASILAADFRHLEDQIQQAEAAGVDWIHVDVMDGQFVPNISMGPLFVDLCRQITALPLDVHLMIEQPERHIEAFAEAGATTLSVHIEGNPNIHRTLQEIRRLGMRPAIVLNPGTPACAISAVLPLIDMVLVMTVNPGFGGQSYLPEVEAKIMEIERMIQDIGRPVQIEVDGGIDTETISGSYWAGARVFVAGTSIFKHPNGIAAGIQALRQPIV